MSLRGQSLFRLRGKEIWGSHGFQGGLTRRQQSIMGGIWKIDCQCNYQWEEEIITILQSLRRDQVNFIIVQPKDFISVMQFCKLSPMPLATTPYSKQGWMSDLLTCSKLHQGVKRLSLTIMPIDILFSRRCEQCENSIQERLSSI